MEEDEEALVAGSLSLSKRLCGVFPDVLISSTEHNVNLVPPGRKSEIQMPGIYPYRLAKEGITCGVRSPGPGGDRPGETGRGDIEMLIGDEEETLS